ncbi:MAG: diphosphomevalonate decarboxylase [Legionella sp.]|nr:diphosphomevalonate decarboxylase [Legionella sp.]
MHWLAQAPANIALIKYMGKQDDRVNLPANASFSYTLPHLLSTVKLEALTSQKDLWEPLIIPGGPDFRLPESAQRRFIEHLNRIKTVFSYEGGFLIQSSNNFPHSTGLASSASSFAALTKCAILALCELTGQPIPSIDEQAQLSRLGSGSSCRSYYAPWALWQGKTVCPVDLPYKELIHQVVVVNSQEKEVSSKEAHKRVKSSVHYAGRIERAEANLKALLNALMAQNWSDAYQICWREFQDMHMLFNTCTDPFVYQTTSGQNLLKDLQDFWHVNKDGPIITMDAGPNIHLLYRMDQGSLAEQIRQMYLVGNFDVL